MGSMGLGAAIGAAIIVAMTAIASPLPAGAEPLVRVAVEEYGVAGDTGARLMAEIRAKGPRHGLLSRAIAQTRYSLEYDFDALGRDDICRVARAEVRLTITYHYPRLAGRVAPSLLNRWQNFMRSVRKHEEGHGALARKMAREVERALLTLSETGGTSACRRIKREAPALVQRIYDEYEARQRRFDADEHRDGGSIDSMVARLVGEKG